MLLGGEWTVATVVECDEGGASFVFVVEITCSFFSGVKFTYVIERGAGLRDVSMSGVMLT